MNYQPKSLQTLPESFHFPLIYEIYEGSASTSLLLLAHISSWAMQFHPLILVLFARSAMEGI